MNLPRRILFVAAHCDDIELFAGGFLGRAARERLDINVMVFSDHRGVLSLADAERARHEMVENLSWLSSNTGARIADRSPPPLGACNGDFDRERASIYAAMEALRGRIDLVVTHSSTDTNQDHRRVAEEAARVFKAHATLLGGEFPNNDLGNSRAEIYLKLDAADVEAKARMIERYRTQDRWGRPYLSGDLARCLARVRGAQIREQYAEAFSVLTRAIFR